MRLWPSSIESLANTVDKSVLPRVHDGHEKRMFPLMDRLENKELNRPSLKRCTFWNVNNLVKSKKIRLFVCGRSMLWSRFCSKGL